MDYPYAALLTQAREDLLLFNEKKKPNAETDSTHPTLGKPFAFGNTATLYRQGNFAIKLYHPHLPAEEVEKEYRNHHFAYQLNLFVPDVHRITSYQLQHALILDYVDGEPLGTNCWKSLYTLDQCMLTAVKQQHHLHRIPLKKTEKIELMPQKLKRQIHQVDDLSSSRKHHLLNLLQQLVESSTSQSLCHGDFHFFNLIKTKKGISMIDWVDASIGFPCADACRSYLLYASISQALATLYLYLYCAEGKLDEEEVLNWLPILACARLSENVASDSKEQLHRWIYGK
ncbi:phosphotransferase family protein [Shouchella lehensis]|uniref:Aminoglycoside phosphotransferase family protein n=1 Tax=Shouchella lehensis TaxID=300825 RepID=A0A4Y7WMM1_9BACI|nr:aminoglycoside phosphotransferase family protein [Shouchella lehensis]TES49742.1 aminoglycoside phosphotransferase family protein [Shouchella lehensis]